MDKEKKSSCNKVANDLHKMELEMKKIDFSFLELQNLFVEIENESLALYIKFLRS